MMAAQNSKEKELTGRQVLLMLLAFFGVTLAVNAYFTFVAVKSFRGEDVKGSYRQGLEYNATISARTQQQALGWTTRTNVLENIVDGRDLIVQMTGPDNRPLTGLTITGVLRHPVDLEKDIPLVFSDTGAGRFKADLDDISGQWQLRATASIEDSQFKFEQDIWVK